MYSRFPKKPPTLSTLYRSTNRLFFKKEPLFGPPWLGRCKSSKCPFHMSIIRTCATHRAVYITNGIQTVYLLRHCRGSYVSRSVDSCNKILLWRYRSTKRHTLHTTLQKIVERCRIWWLCCPLNQFIDLDKSNVEVIPHISIKVRRWVKGCIPAVLGHQNESEQIVKSVRFQTSDTLHSQTGSFRTGVSSWTMISLPSCTTY